MIRRKGSLAQSTFQKGCLLESGVHLALFETQNHVAFQSKVICQTPGVLSQLTLLRGLTARLNTCHGLKDSICLQSLGNSLAFRPMPKVLVQHSVELTQTSLSSCLLVCQLIDFQNSRLLGIIRTSFSGNRWDWWLFLTRHSLGFKITSQVRKPRNSSVTFLEMQQMPQNPYFVRAKSSEAILRMRWTYRSPENHREAGRTRPLLSLAGIWHLLALVLSACLVTQSYKSRYTTEPTQQKGESVDEALCPEPIGQGIWGAGSIRYQEDYISLKNSAYEG